VTALAAARCAAARAKGGVPSEGSRGEKRHPLPLPDVGLATGGGARGAGHGRRPRHAGTGTRPSPARVVPKRADCRAARCDRLFPPPAPGDPAGSAVRSEPGDAFALKPAGRATG